MVNVHRKKAQAWSGLLCSFLIFLPMLRRGPLQPLQGGLGCVSRNIHLQSRVFCYVYSVSMWRVLPRLVVLQLRLRTGTDRLVVLRLRLRKGLVVAE